MMAWGIHFPHAAITSPEHAWCTLRHASGYLYFPECRINPVERKCSGRSPFPGSHHVDVGNDQAEDDESRQVGASANHEDDVVPMGGISLGGEPGQGQMVRPTA